MDEKPKSIWKKSWTGWRGLGTGWLILSFALIIIFLIWVMASGTPLARSGDEFRLFVVFWIAVTIIFLLATFIRLLFCRRNFKRGLFGLACFATLIALFYAEEDWRGWHDWNKFKSQWEAKGEHFSFASIVPPPVPDNQNFALTPVVASCYEYYFDKHGNELMPRNTNVVDRLTMLSWRDNPWTKSLSAVPCWPEGKFFDLKPWQAFFRSEPPPNSRWAHSTNSFPVAPEPQSPAADVLLALSKYDSAIEELRQASQLPYSRFPLTYGKDDPAEILLPHLAALKLCAQTLTLRAIAELQNGQSEQALDDVKLAVYLVNSIRTEPFLISHLVRIGMFQFALQPVYAGLAEHEWSDAQLAELDSELAKLDFLADYRLAMRGEMGLEGANIDYLIRHRRELSNISSGNGSTPPPPFVSSLIPTGWFYQNRLNCARVMVEYYLPLADVKQETVSPSAVRRADEVLQTKIRLTPYNFLEPFLFPPFVNPVKNFAYAQSSVDLARTAIALERYRLAHGDYPASLDALAPRLIAKVPHDVIGGGPLHYRLTSDGQFVLYSIGWNERDDGGVVVFAGRDRNPRDESNLPVDINQGDWVWRYPQK